MHAGKIPYHLAAGRRWPALCASLCILGAAFCCRATDWPQYRGANHDGISPDRINPRWSGTVTNPVWLVPLPSCVGSLAVSGGRAFTMARRLIDGVDKDACVGLNITNGAELWVTAIEDANYPDGGVGFADGPRTTPAVADGSVFVLSSYLKLYRLDATNGTVIWQKDLVSLYGGTVIPWQNAASPRVDGGLIYVNANCGTSTLMALRTSDGSVAWRSQDEAMTHSTPVLAAIHGTRQVIFATQSGLVSLDPGSGGLLWTFPYPFLYSTSLGVSPVVYGDMVFVCGAHSYGMGSVVVRATLTNGVWSATKLWSTNNPAAHWMTPVCYQGFLYGQFGIQQFDSVSAQLKCIDMTTGAVMWSVNGFGRGATMLAGGRLLTLTERGDLVMALADPGGYTELGRFQAIPDYNDFTNKCWNSLAIADGRVYARSLSYAAAYDLSVPGLLLDPPQIVSPGQLQLTIRTADGTPIDSNRLAGLEILASPDLTRAPGEWTPLTNPPELLDGLLRINNVDSEMTRRFFITTEPR